MAHMRRQGGSLATPKAAALKIKRGSRFLNPDKQWNAAEKDPGHSLPLTTITMICVGS